MYLPILISLLIACAVFVAASVKRIPEGQVYSLRRMGRPAGLLTAGTHLVMPVIDRVAHKISLNGQVLRFEDHVAENADARDVRGTVYWQVLEPERADAVIDHVDELIRGRAVLALHAESMDAGSDHRALGARLKNTMNGGLRDSGMLVTRVDLDFA
jgi:regulator of protease activity HflC (stomatin/prohibitin superfamily)